jgi:tetratricopeptide (TPR) repeat protein
VPYYLKRILLLPGIILVSSCTTSPKQEAPVVDIIDRSSGPSASVVKPRADSNPLVVAGLQQNASELNRQGEPAKAASILERAIRIQPRNPQLWHELAQVRYAQKRYQQAESLALRSNQYALRRHDIQRANWLLIANARQKQGNAKGAANARKQAQRLDGR